MKTLVVIDQKGSSHIFDLDENDLDWFVEGNHIRVYYRFTERPGVEPRSRTIAAFCNYTSAKVM